MPEIVVHGRTGFVCGDVREMPAAVERIASIDRRACRAHVEAHFSAGRMVAEHVRLYEDVVAGRAVTACSRSS